MIFKFYTKLFLELSICFGLMMSVTYYDGQKEIWSAIVKGLYMGLFFGFVITAFLAFFHTRSVRQIPNSTDEDIVNSRQTRVIYVQLEPQQAAGICLRALSEINATLTKNSGDGNVTGQTGFSFNSFGENISFRIYGNASKSQIVITSQPRAIGAVVIDYGKNLINVNHLEEFILREAGKFPANLPSGENTEFFSASALESRSFDSASV